MCIFYLLDTFPDGSFPTHKPFITNIKLLCKYKYRQIFTVTLHTKIMVDKKVEFSQAVKRQYTCWKKYLKFSKVRFKCVTLNFLPWNHLLLSIQFLSCVLHQFYIYALLYNFTEKDICWTLTNLWLIILSGM